MTETTLTMTEEQHKTLYAHLFPDDGCEAVALAVCGRHNGFEREKLIVRKITLVPYDQCSERAPDRVTWPTRVLEPLLAEAAQSGGAIVKLHGHRAYAQFSSVDDVSDRALFPGIYNWVDDGMPHASVILLDDGRVFGRVVTADGIFVALSSVSIIGDNLLVFKSDEENQTPVPQHARRIAQSFGSHTYEQLKSLRVAVVGCSGTGSVVIEQLARNCVGMLVLVDPDHVERKNLNRILNATAADAETGLAKVQLAKRSIEAMGLGTQVIAIRDTLFSCEAVRAAASCDVVFGCVDTVDGRHILGRLCAFYSIPYFDLGVRIDADGTGGVDQVCGSVHYVKPGGSSLFSRGVYNMEQVRAAGLFRNDPVAYKDLLNRGYIRGVREDQPAVIQLNSLVGSLAINELLARIHPYRIDPNGEFATTRISLSHGIFEHEAEGYACEVFAKHVGKGDVTPLLDLAELSVTKAAAE